MSTSVFPSSLDTYTNPTATNPTNSPSLSAGQTLQNDALFALETKVGVDSSAVTTTLDYKVKNSASPINSAITTAQGNIVQLQQSATTLYTDTGTANAYAVAPSTSIGAYAAGQTFTFIPANTNTGASTLNVNGLGAKAIQYGGANVAAGNISSKAAVTVRYDGTYFQLLNPIFGAWTAWTPTLGAAGSMTYGTTTINYAKYIIIGKTLSFQVSVNGTTGGSASKSLTFTPPATLAVGGASLAGAGYVNDGSGNFSAQVIGTNTNLISVYRYDNANFTLGAGEGYSVSGTMELA